MALSTMVPVVWQETAGRVTGHPTYVLYAVNFTDADPSWWTTMSPRDPRRDRSRSPRRDRSRSPKRHDRNPPRRDRSPPRERRRWTDAPQPTAAAPPIQLDAGASLTTTNVDPATGFEFQRRTDGWPADGSGFSLNDARAAAATMKKIQTLQDVPGNLRHDIIVPQWAPSRLIGKGGAAFKEMTAKTLCSIHIFDKAPPPGEPPDTRMVTLIGTPLQVLSAAAEVKLCVMRNEQRGAEEVRKSKQGSGGATLDFSPEAIVTITEQLPPPAVPPSLPTEVLESIAASLVRAATSTAGSGGADAVDDGPVQQGYITVTDAAVPGFEFTRRADGWPVRNNADGDRESTNKGGQMARQLEVDIT